MAANTRSHWTVLEASPSWDIANKQCREQQRRTVHWTNHAFRDNLLSLRTRTILEHCSDSFLVMCPYLYINSCSLTTDEHKQHQSDSTTYLRESPIDHITLVRLLVINNMTRTSRSAHLPLGNSTPPSQARGQGHGEGSNPRTTSARGITRVERARQIRNERDRKQRCGEIKGIFIPRKQSTLPKNTTKGFKDTAKENSIDDLYSASSLPHPQ